MRNIFIEQKEQKKRKENKGFSSKTAKAFHSGQSPAY